MRIKKISMKIIVFILMLFFSNCSYKDYMVLTEDYQKAVYTPGKDKIVFIKFHTIFKPAKGLLEKPKVFSNTWLKPNSGWQLFFTVTLSRSFSFVSKCNQWLKHLSFDTFRINSEYSRMTIFYIFQALPNRGLVTRWSSSYALIIPKAIERNLVSASSTREEIKIGTFAPIATCATLNLQ